jgi:RimJ/RimL family protein N-acetyltransferase
MTEDIGEKHIRLSPLYPWDIDAIRDMRNDERIWRWCRQNSVIDPQQHEAWYQRQASDPTIKMFAIRSSGILGVCGLTDIDRINQRTEFSLYIDPLYQKEGFGKMALKLLLNHAFMDQNLNVVWGETFDGNPALDMFIGLGMSCEGRRREFYFKGGKFIDAFLISMTRTEFFECAKNW